MRISVSEWSALKLAVKLPRAALNPELIGPTLRRHARTRRGMAVIGLALTALLVFLHFGAAAPAVTRGTDLVAGLAELQAIDARWDGALVHVRLVRGNTPASVLRDTDLPRIQRVLDAAHAAASTTALRTAIADLRKTYVEKADLIARYEAAATDVRSALAAALRAETAVTLLIREAWRDFEQRDRLVAAENLVLRVISEAQQYHYAPSADRRADLEAQAADLPRLKSLPKLMQSSLGRLEADVHQLLLVKPLEQMLAERLVALDTRTRATELADVFQRELTEAIARRDRYTIALLVYTVALLAAIAWLGVRAIARYRDLEVLYAGRTRDLARALTRLKELERGSHGAGARRPSSAQQEDAAVVAEHRRERVS